MRLHPHRSRPRNSREAQAQVSAPLSPTGILLRMQGVAAAEQRGSPAFVDE
jgi:hypothetical protein